MFNRKGEINSRKHNNDGELLKELKEEGLHLGKNDSETGKKVLERSLRKLDVKNFKNR